MESSSTLAPQSFSFTENSCAGVQLERRNPRGGTLLNCFKRGLDLTHFDLVDSSCLYRLAKIDTQLRSILNLCEIGPMRRSPASANLPRRTASAHVEAGEAFE